MLTWFYVLSNNSSHLSSEDDKKDIRASVVTERSRLGLLQHSASSSGVIFGLLPVSGYTNPELSITSVSMRTFSVIACL